MTVEGHSEQVHTAVFQTLKGVTHKGIVVRIVKLIFHPHGR